MHQRLTWTIFSKNAAHTLHVDLSLERPFFVEQKRTHAILPLPSINCHPYSPRPLGALSRRQRRRRRWQCWRRPQHHTFRRPTLRPMSRPVPPTSQPMPCYPPAVISAPTSCHPPAVSSAQRRGLVPAVSFARRRGLHRAHAVSFAPTKDLPSPLPPCPPPASIVLPLRVAPTAKPLFAPAQTPVASQALPPMLMFPPTPKLTPTPGSPSPIALAKSEFPTNKFHGRYCYQHMTMSH